MDEKTKNLVIYIIKGVLSTLAIFSISDLIHYKNLAWALISVILVLAPEGSETMKMAFNRVKANLVGAAVGLLCLLTGYSNMWTMALAISLTLIVSHWLNLDTSTRTALAATIIIMLHPEGTHLWDTAFERVTAVFVGGLLGLLITFIFHSIYKPGKKLAIAKVPEEENSE